MRLWHEKLIPLLPDLQLKSQNRECFAMMGEGWEKPHSIVNYAWEHGKETLAAYHCLVQDEMKKRGMKIKRDWKTVALDLLHLGEDGKTLYPEHDDRYLVICLYNLMEKGHDLWKHFPHVFQYKIGA